MSQHGYGGIERVTNTVVALEWPRGILVDLVESKGWHGSLPRRLRKLGFAYVALIHALTRRPRAVLSMHANLGAVAVLAALLARAPLIIWAHGYEVWGDIPWSRRIALRRAKAVLAGSTYTASRLIEDQGVNSRRIRVVRYAVIDTARALPPANHAKEGVVTVARFATVDADKGVDTLLLAMPHILRSRPGASLVVVGDGDDRGRLESLAECLFLTDSVRFAGGVSDEELAEIYAKSRVFALPGRAGMRPRPYGEGFGLVFIEAGAAGLPAIAGRAAGATDAVVDGVTGLLADPSSPADVADKVLSCLSDEELANRLGAAGRKRAITEFGRDRLKRDLGEVFDELMAGF